MNNNNNNNNNNTLFFNKNSAADNIHERNKKPDQQTIASKVWNERNLSFSIEAFEDKVKSIDSLKDLSVLLNDDRSSTGDECSYEFKLLIFNDPSLIFHLLNNDNDVGIANDILKPHTKHSFDLSNKIKNYLLQNPNNIHENLERLMECSNLIEKFCLSLTEDSDCFLMLMPNYRALCGVLFHIHPKNHELLINKFISDDKIFDAIYLNSKLSFGGIFEPLSLYQQKKLAIKILDYIIERDGLLEKLVLTKNPSTISPHDALMNFMRLNMSMYDYVCDYLPRHFGIRAYRINFANLIFDKIYTAALNNKVIFNKALSTMAPHIYIINFFSGQESFLDRIKDDIEEGVYPFDRDITYLSDYATKIVTSTLLDKSMVRRLSHWIEIIALAEVIPRDKADEFIQIILSDHELCQRICHQSENLSRELFIPQDNGKSTLGDHPNIPRLDPIKFLTELYPYVKSLLKYMSESERNLINTVTVQRGVIKHELNKYLLEHPECLNNERDKKKPEEENNIGNENSVGLEENTNNNNNENDTFKYNLGP